MTELPNAPGHFGQRVCPGRTSEHLQGFELHSSQSFAFGGPLQVLHSFEPVASSVDALIDKLNLPPYHIPKITNPRISNNIVILVAVDRPGIIIARITIPSNITAKIILSDES
jgi:hypothetical protein